MSGVAVEGTALCGPTLLSYKSGPLLVKYLFLHTPEFIESNSSVFKFTYQ